MANDAGTAYIDVLPEFKGFGSRLSRGIDPHVDRSAKNVESKLGGAFKSAAGVAAGAFAAVGAVSVFKGLISGASDLNETISKSNTIFGSNAKEIEKWADGAAKSMGQSKQGALDAAATFGNLFVQLGTGSGEAAKMSKEMVGLASDFASFHNADPTDVIESMTAAFRGEYDAVQRYVPTINAAAVEQEALKMGLAKTTKELTAQDKALATQALLMKGAGAAVGDFARTSDGLANRQRILSAQFQDTKDRLGTALLPVVLRVMEGFLKLSAAVSGPAKRAFEGFKSVAKGVFDIFAKGDFTGGFESLGIQEDSPVIAGLFRFREIIVSVVDFIKANLQPVLAALGAAAAVAFGVWASAAIPAAAATIAAAAPVIALGAAIAALAGTLVYAYQNFEGFKSVVDGVASFLTGTVWPKIQEFAGFISDQFGKLADWTRQHWGAVQEAITHVVNAMWAVIKSFIGAVQDAWRIWGDELMNIARIIWNEISAIIEVALDLIRGVVETALALINGDWGQAWDAIKGVLSDAWDFIATTLANALRLMREAVEGALSGLVAYMGSVPGMILDALGNLGDLLWNAGVNLIEGLIGGIKSMAGKAASAAWDVVKGAAKAAWDAVIPGSPSKVGRAIGENFGAGIAAGIAGSSQWVERSSSALMGDAIAQAAKATGSIGLNAWSHPSPGGGGRAMRASLTPVSQPKAIVAAKNGVGAAPHTHDIVIDGQKVGEARGVANGVSKGQRRAAGAYR